MYIDKVLYRKAFQIYMRKGIPIDLSLKRARTTTHYIWRTQRDGKVRSSHAANEGKIFAWDNPPETGHPGEAPNCRCRAEPYVPNISEYMEITLSGVSNEGTTWSTPQFVWHYFFGGGETLILSKVGVLEQVVDRFMQLAEARLKNQIADKARENIGRHFKYDTSDGYEVGDLVFVLGETAISSFFEGNCRSENGMLFINGKFTFTQDDWYKDSLDVLNLIKEGAKDKTSKINPPGGDGFDFSNIDPPGGEKYRFHDKWEGKLRGRILEDPSQSRFKE